MFALRRGERSGWCVELPTRYAGPYVNASKLRVMTVGAVLIVLSGIVVVVAVLFLGKPLPVKHPDPDESDREP